MGEIKIIKNSHGESFFVYGITQEESIDDDIIIETWHMVKQGNYDTITDEKKSDP